MATVSFMQWCNSWGENAPQTLLTEKFLLSYWENRGKEKRENGEEKKENQKREGGKLKMEEGRVSKWEEDFLKKFFIFYFTYLFLYFFAFHFSKPQKSVLGLPKWEFCTGKCGKKIQENYFAPSEKKNPFLLRPWFHVPGPDTCL